LTKFKDQLEQKKKEKSIENEESALSVFWAAPELFDEPDAHSNQSDVYSYAIVMWEIATRKQPYEGMSPEAVAIAVVQSKARPAMPDDGFMPEEFTE